MLFVFCDLFLMMIICLVLSVVIGCSRVVLMMLNVVVCVLIFRVRISMMVVEMSGFLCRVCSVS